MEEVELDIKEVKYIYNNRGEYWFSEKNDPSKRFSLAEKTIGDKGKFLKANTMVELVEFNGKIVSVRPPIKVELKVTEAPPGIRGDTAQGGQKQVTLETGAVINAPLFVDVGDTIRVNTESGEYVERV